MAKRYCGIFASLLILISHTHLAAQEPFITLAEAYTHTGTSHTAMGAYNQAIEAYIEALSLQPDCVEVQQKLGHAYAQKGQFIDAAEILTKALELDPLHLETYITLAHVKCEQHDFDAAMALYTKAHALKPDEPRALLGLANTLNLLNKTEDALGIYHRLLTMTNNSASILYNIAYTLKKQGTLPEAFAYYHRALAKDPNNTETLFGLGLAYLLAGDFDRGWPLYEYRFKRTGNHARTFAQPVWDGATPLRNKTILLHAEQGLGDSIQCVRYAQLIKEQGAHVIVATQAPLVTLFSACCPYIDKVIPLTEMYEYACDVHAPLMSLPLLLKTTVSSIPKNVPYVFPDAELVKQWKNILDKDKKFKVGLCWETNQDCNTLISRLAASARSIDVELYRTLADCAQVSFYSLQRISDDKQPSCVINNFGHTVDTDHGRFMDTAAIIKNLDLVISVDTAICHLAGAIGVPVWVPLPYSPDWRWMLHRSDSPWYPTMQLFRQQTAGDWHTVIKKISDELQHTHRPHKKIIKAEISLGDLIDRIIILEIKHETFTDATKIDHVQAELASLRATYDECITSSDELKLLEHQLKETNKRMWEIEDFVRAKEQMKQFDAEFIQLSRNIYCLNDTRALIKRAINTMLGSHIVEEKSYVLTGQID